MSEGFEPRIVGFLCNWCSYAGADLAGTGRVQYPPNARFIRVMCTGRMDPQFILEAFKDGADGVFIGGCHFGDCHYLKGNYKADRKIRLTQKLLSELGFDPRRVRFEKVSASEGTRFGEVITDFINEIKKLGPLPVSDACFPHERKHHGGAASHAKTEHQSSVVLAPHPHHENGEPGKDESPHPHHKRDANGKHDLNSKGASE